MTLLLLACTGPKERELHTAEDVFELGVITFNSGTTEGQAYDESYDGYGEEQAAASDEHYGDGLAWAGAIEETASFLAGQDEGIVGFQEIFDVAECAEVPEDARAGFVCEIWTEGDPSVAEAVLGDGWTVQCHPGHGDKCAAMDERFGELPALSGEEVPGCGSGARVAWADVELEIGAVRVIHVHGSSGLSEDDVGCRVAQVAQVEAALAERNIVLGDLNTDPVRFAGYDDSAVAWAELAERAGLSWHTDIGEDAEPTYGGLANIDHVLSDWAVGECRSTAFYGGVYFDHVPQVCKLLEP